MGNGAFLLVNGQAVGAGKLTVNGQSMSISGLWTTVGAVHHDGREIV